MFDIRSYAILLNELFETGLDCAELAECISEKLAAENESVKPVDNTSSRLHLILNNNKVMFVFTELTDGKVRLHRQFLGKIKEIGQTEFLPIELNGKKCLGLFVDEVMVCAISSVFSRETGCQENIRIH